MQRHLRSPFLPSATDLTVRFADVDMMQVVHHSAYVHWFEQIRFSFLERIMGLRCEELTRERIAFPVIECHINYRHAIRFGDALLGYARVQRQRKSMISFFYSVYPRDVSNRPCADGYTTHCYVGPRMELLLAPPQLIESALASAKTRYPDCTQED